MTKKNVRVVAVDNEWAEFLAHMKKEVESSLALAERQAERGGQPPKGTRLD